MVIPGYWENPQATEDSFVAGYWRSGDIGSIDAEGFVRVFDRVKDMINRGGYKIYSLEVENVLCHHSTILECAVVGKYCEVLGERVMAHIKLRPGQAVTAEALRIYCLERLADYKVPESFIFSDSPLPRNANGKLLKRTLRDQTDPINP
jgi:acyl-CoA synthetase (AMP-forming)/AMP-acid ligase II